MAGMRFIALIFFLPHILFSQPKIDQAGDDWAGKVRMSLDSIRVLDQNSYRTIVDHVDRISFWLGDFSSTTIGEDGEKIILISTKDLALGSINNISALLVHESIHLWVLDNNIQMDENSEEVLCYSLEYEFLKKIKNVEPWLLEHAVNGINNHKNKKLNK